MDTVEQTLEAHGLDSKRLLGIVRDVALARSRSVPHMSADVYDDLVGFLAVRAVEAVARYDSTRSA